jgi:hypothetical protein
MTSNDGICAADNQPYSVTGQRDPRNPAETLSIVPSTLFLAKKGKKLHLRDTLKLPAKGLRPSAHPPLFGQT